MRTLRSEAGRLDYRLRLRHRGLAERLPATGRTGSSFGLPVSKGLATRWETKNPGHRDRNVMHVT